MATIKSYPKGEVRPYSEVIKPPTEDERSALRESIIRYGQRDAIIVDENGDILDGHNRFAILTELSKSRAKALKERFAPENWKVETVEFGDDFDEESRTAFARSINLARRHYSVEDRKALAANIITQSPRSSDIAIAASVGLSKNTVRAVRSKTSVKSASQVKRDEAVAHWLTLDAEIRRAVLAGEK